MVSEPNSILGVQKSIALKLDEPRVDSENPWADDLLGRQGIATRLTNLVATQEAPLTVSLHGQWGTGKTFMLRRWQKELESKDFRAIYFNAWEDDFCDDPLLAFIGQLSDYFKETGLKALAERASEIAIPLITKNVSGVLKTKFGITINLNELGNRRKSLLVIYQKQRATKDKLRDQLATLAARVFSETGHPLVFIVDELDRCRPTFAIELLERVKHIFDVPHIVFVFGLNRDELCKSLRSVYGNIDADVYLRRFFDFEFNLRDVNSEAFAEQLIDNFRLSEVFQSISDAMGSPNLVHDFQNFKTVCPKVWNALNLSLRDIDYAVRLIALLTRNMELGVHTHPYLVALLIGFKFKNSELYDSLVSVNFRTSEIIKYLISESGADLTGRNFLVHLDRIEGFLYCADSANIGEAEGGIRASHELLSLMHREKRALPFEIISERAQNSDEDGLGRITQAIVDGRQLGIDGTVLGRLAEWIDTYQADLRR